MVRNIPFGGSVLTLPDGPSNGDWYGIANIDGSASITHPMSVQVSQAGFDAGQLIEGSVIFPVNEPYGYAIATFNEGGNSWAITFGNGSALIPVRARTQATALNGTVVGGGPSVVCEVTFVPLAGGAAPDLEISWFVTAQNSESGTFTPQITATPQGGSPTVLAQSAQYIAGQSFCWKGSITSGNGFPGFFVAGTQYTIALTSSAGDASQTLGFETVGVSAAIRVNQLPFL